MFYSAPWTQAAWDASCQQQFTTTTRPQWILDTFGDAAGFAKSAGNIVFSNGDRDPWSMGQQTVRMRTEDEQRCYDKFPR